MKSISKKYIDKKFEEQIERLKSELQESIVQTTASYNYKQFATQESFNITLEIYKKLFDAREVFQKLWNRKLDDITVNKYLDDLREYQKLVFANQVLLDETIFEYFRDIIGGMIEIALNIHTEVQVEAAHLKELRDKLATVTNLIRNKFGLKSIPHEIIGSKIVDVENHE